MQGGAGNDVYIVDNLLDNPQELAFGGTDTVRSSVNWTLGSDFNNLTLTGTAISGSGNNIANTIVGNASNNNIFGNAGNDLMYGGSGTDFLNGGSDNDLIQGFGYSTFEYDTMTGGVGADKFVLGDTSGSFYVGFGYATITDFQWEEVDKIQVKGPLSDYTLDPNVNFGGGAALDTAIYRSGELIGVALDQTDLIISLDFLGV
jgi:Ca2+-binding RTX toxin-like protein